eukprot:TRINITY_DN3533_c0_g1_i15.p1 TRINITY_DN3533_c0_g1~~TRINITY_DN3533_c0_g1_i15.p1  ORF type:complete len:250 (-),score=44.64 TRINITY_DN3533_c0_g1_i15:182-931(-)
MAAQVGNKLKAPLEAGAEAVAKGLLQYVHPTQRPKFRKSVRRQLEEMNGTVPFGKGNYHNVHYENLVKHLSETRKGFRASKNAKERMDIANSQFKAWRTYINTRIQESPKEFTVSDEMKSNLKTIFDLVKERQSSTLPNTKIIEFHQEYGKSFKFTIPIDGLYLVQMIHPQRGYLSYNKADYSFDELYWTYQMKCLATYEKSLGQDLLAHEITAYPYWCLHDFMDGYMNLEKFSEFMKVTLLHRQGGKP